MTPKEKAEELVDRLYQTTPNEGWFNPPLGLQEEYKSWKQAKQCALIAVDEIINSIKSFREIEKTSVAIVYWQQVKQEIEKL